MNAGPADAYRSRVLVIESDPAAAADLAAALSGFHCTMISSLRELREFNVSEVDMAFCSSALADGRWLEALVHLRGVRSDLPVIVTAKEVETAIAVEAIRAGAMDFLAIGRDHAAALPLTLEKCLAHQRMKVENERLHRELSRSLGELADKNLQLHAMISRLETMARTDELTGLCNRRRLNEMIERYWTEALRNDLPLACVMLDLDDFKHLNDAMGHQRGDTVLRMVGRIIEANCRQVDVPARYGGDEFCILMPNTQAHEAAMVAQRILREFETALCEGPGGEPRVGISIGVSHIDLSRPISAEQLIAHADEAMYAAKGQGKRTVMVRGPETVFAHCDNLNTLVFHGRV